MVPISKLLDLGYKPGQLWSDNQRDNIPKDGVMVTNEDGSRSMFIITSTRIVLPGREVPGGPLGEKFGIICAEDVRSNTFENTLAGGRLEPYSVDYRTEEDTEVEESVLECLVRETEEEIAITLNPEKVTLIGLRTITEENSGKLKYLNGCVCADAYFVGFVGERLRAHYGRNGETGDRRVLSPETLLKVQTSEWEKKQLPQTQRLALAAAIMTMWDFWGGELTLPIRELISRTLLLARSVYHSSSWKGNYIPIIEAS